MEVTLTSPPSSPAERVALAAPSAAVRATAPRRRRGGWFMPCFAALVVLVVALGFGRTFLLPLLGGRFSRPWFVYAHGALFFAWVALLVAQVWLAARRRVRWHQRLGWAGAVLVPLMAASGVAVGVWATRRDLALGQPEAIAFFFGLLMDMLLFFVFGSAALLMRRRSATHKRLIVFATIAVLGAAVGRVPVVGGAANGLAIGLVLAVLGYDLAVERRVRMVSVLGGALLLAGIYSETPLGQTRAWAGVGPAVLASLTPP
jgi:hypothetical protein